ncbi:hypothetical protein FSP39_024582 [Pinctada imbricata]|uniref:DDE-1 domain-containing protein n=1 Tax=Pinctada imbricata TaxID=66713 RepID=A0AA88XUP7_PINIB|nr:hypothetical protein FSP39_024582 [Pinctada imbricata]
MPRTQKIHQEEEINKAVALYKEGLSMRKIANELCIPKSTVYDHVKGKFSGYNTSFGREPSLSYDEEVSVVNYSVYMAERGLPLNRQNLRILIKEILLRRPRPTSINLEKGPSDKFITKFLKRHKDSISIRSSHPLESNRATISQGQIDHFYQLLQDMMSKLDPNDKPSRMYNMDESGFSGRLTSSKKVIVPKDTRHAYQTQVTMSGHVTVVQAISAGGESCPPMIIFSGCLPRGTYEAGVPDKFIFRSTDSGFINNALFLEWFEEAFKPSLGKERPVLLLLDNHVSHCHPQFIDKAKHHGVDLLYFPSHASHLLQPLDVVYFHILKQKFADLAIKIGYMGCKTLPRNLFPRLLHQAYNNITGST